MRVRLPGRPQPGEDRPDDLFELDEIEWKAPRDGADEPPPRRRRRFPPRWVGLGLALAALGAGAALAYEQLSHVTANVAPLSGREQAQLEAAAPGISRQGRGASLPLPARARRAAAALPLRRAVAQLF